MQNGRKKRYDCRFLAFSLWWRVHGPHEIFNLGRSSRKRRFSQHRSSFKAIAYAEQVHAGNHFNVLNGNIGDHPVTAGGVFGLKNTTENLKGGIIGEEFEVDQMYPAYLEVAKMQKEEEAVRSFTFALEAEKIHAELFKKAKEAAEQGKDFEVNKIYICPICGHTVTDELPNQCPVCGAKKGIYKEF